MGPRFHKIVAPDMIPTLRPQSNTGAVVEPQSAAGLVFHRNLQTLSPPDTLHSIFADLPASLVQQRRDPPVSIPAILTGQGKDGLGQPVFVVPLRGLVALRPPRLAPYTAGPPFT